MNFNKLDYSVSRISPFEPKYNSITNQTLNFLLTRRYLDQIIENKFGKKRKT